MSFQTSKQVPAQQLESKKEGAQWDFDARHPRSPSGTSPVLMRRPSRTETAYKDTLAFGHHLPRGSPRVEHQMRHDHQGFMSTTHRGSRNHRELMEILGQESDYYTTDLEPHSDIAPFIGFQMIAAMLLVLVGVFTCKRLYRARHASGTEENLLHTHVEPALH